MLPEMKERTANSCRSCRVTFLEMSAIQAVWDNRMRELVTVTVLTTISALPQIKAHVQASLNAGCTPVGDPGGSLPVRALYRFSKTLNAISAMNEVFAENGIELPPARPEDFDRVENDGGALSEKD